ncbi:MAG: hypothetical protein U0441_30815 [Polyangiaceae bacterium]
MEPSNRPVLLAIAAFVVAGCTPHVEAGGGSGGATASGGAGGATTTPSTTASGGSGGSTETGLSTLKVQAGPFTIPSGEEAVKCIVVDAGNDESVIVRKFQTTLAEGSHHMIVYTTDLPPNPTPYSCQSFGVGGSAIFIAQQAESALTFPTDASGLPVGLVLNPHQSLVMEVHYINATAAPLDVSGTVSMDVLPESANVIKAGFAFYGNLSIPTIPAHGEADTGVLMQQVNPGAKVFALTTHQHHLGTRMQVWYSTDASDLSTQVADSTSWSDPPLVTFDPPIEFPADGSKSFAYDCHWKNPTDKAVYGGLSANDEMCFFWSYFYPAGG